ncbi:hypothetical protein TELCIR_08566 [Teladorsagia circumcincta]|uniref:EGF-like domain-containing protein n=1 Tax=Teladorsagia circumcincta TaxID=45464 RepID=A0A2G9UH86_TELCI|nr:hypothetical protein TELCIR_08566 [Teladorsagia circumcincta]
MKTSKRHNIFIFRCDPVQGCCDCPPGRYGTRCQFGSTNPHNSVTRTLKIGEKWAWFRKEGKVNVLAGSMECVGKADMERIVSINVNATTAPHATEKRANAAVLQGIWDPHVSMR